MDDEQLKHLIRESYPFPIAHAHKKVAGMLADDGRKLQGIVETAELTVQFLALLALAQVRQDLLDDHLPELPASLTLTRPSFGSWCYLLQNVLEAYRRHPEHLIVPELLRFYEQEVQQGAARVHLVESPVLGALRELRNDFHHRRIPERQIPASIAQGWEWLKHLLAAVQFLAQYKLVFTQRILLGEGAQQTAYYIHDLTVCNGCFSTFDQERWKSGIHLQPESLVFLRKNRFLPLEPFIIFSDYLKGAPDILLLTDYPEGKPEYLATQFAERLSPTETTWKEGWQYHRQLRDFFRRLRKEGPQAQPPESLEDENAEPIVAPAQTQPTEVPPVAAGLPPSSEQSAQSAPHKSPYKFLDYYNPEDADIFFGRDREIQQLEQKFYNCRLLVLHGESGAGKTSLIRAGLIARLHPETYIPVYVRMLQEPLQEVKRELDRQLERPARFSTTAQVSLVECLRQATESVSKTVIIVLDQFEEFFLRFSEDVQQQFTEEFSACVHTLRLDVKFLIALRSDYFSNLETFEQAIPQIFTHQVRLERLSEAQALEAVLKPAQRMGIQVDEAMVQIKLLPELLDEEGGIEPPLLQIVCDALYQHAQSEGRNTIGMADYEAIGDINGSLRQYLDDKLRQFGQRQSQARAVLKALVTTEGTKQAAFLPELSARISSVGVTLTDDELQQQYLNKFVNYRLVRVDEVEGRARYELSHDYLAKHIEAWLAESEREITKVLELIDRAYETYRATNVLLERSALQMIKPYEEQLVLPPDKQQFLDLSKTQVRKQRHNLWLKVAAALMFVALVFGGIFGYQAYQQYREARLNEIEALLQTSHALFLAHDELEALLAGIKAGINTKQINTPAILKNRAIINLREIVYGIHEKNRFVGEHITLSSDGKMFASQYADGTVKIWNTIDGKQLVTLPSDCCGGWIIFSPDSKLLASVEKEKIKLWDIVSGKEVRILVKSSVTPDPNKGSSSLGESDVIAFSLDGMLLASGGGEEGKSGEIKLLDIANSGKPAVFRGHIDWITSMAFSPDNTILASGSRDTTIKLWQVGTGKELATYQGHAGKITKLAFNHDGTVLASGSEDRTIKLWQVSTGKELATCRGDTASITDFKFNPDGTLLASIGKSWSWYGGDVIKLWQVSTGKELTNFRGHTDSIDDIGFSLDGELLFSTSKDGTKLWHIGSDRELTTLQGRGISFNPDGTGLILDIGHNNFTLWNITDIKEEYTILSKHDEPWVKIAFNLDGILIAGGHPIRLWDLANSKELRTLTLEKDYNCFALSPDSTLLASGYGEIDRFREVVDKNGEIKLWNIFDNAEQAIFRGYHGGVLSLAFSPDGKLLASVNKDTITLWRVIDGKELMTLGHTGVKSIVFSPNGKLLASYGLNGTIKLWRVANGKEFISFKGMYGVDKPVFSPDSKLLVLGVGCKGIILWQFANRKTFIISISDALDPGGLPHSVAFSPDSTLLALRDRDFKIRLYQVPEGKELTILDTKSVDNLAFSSDSVLAFGTIGTNGLIEGWNLNLDRLLEDACDVLYGYLKNNPNVSEEDRMLCDDILHNEPPKQKIARQQEQEFQSWINWGRIYAAQGRYIQSVEILQKALALKPWYPSIWLDIGIAYAALNQPEQAMECFLKVQRNFLLAIRSSDKSLVYVPSEVNQNDIWNYIGESLYEQFQYHQAAIVFKSGLSLFPEYLSLLGNDAIVALMQGDISRCLQRLDVALALAQPDNPVLVNLLFLRWLANPAQSYNPVLEAITASGINGEFTREWLDIVPIIAQQNKDVQQIANAFLDFFKEKIDLPTLQVRLAQYDAQKPLPSKLGTESKEQ